MLIAEFVFIIAGFYKVFNFYLIDTDYTLETLQTYYPFFRLLTIKKPFLQKMVGLSIAIFKCFELMYWGVFSLEVFGNWQIKKISYIKIFERLC